MVNKKAYVTVARRNSNDIDIIYIILDTALLCSKYVRNDYINAFIEVKNTIHSEIMNSYLNISCSSTNVVLRLINKKM